MRDASSWALPSSQPSSSANGRLSLPKLTPTTTAAPPRLPLSSSKLNYSRQSFGSCNRGLSAGTPRDKENSGNEGFVLLASPKDNFSLATDRKNNDSSSQPFSTLPSFNKVGKNGSSAAKSAEGATDIFRSPNVAKKGSSDNDGSMTSGLSKNSSGSMVESKRAFWLNLMEQSQSPQNSKESEKYTPLGRMIQKTWTSGSPLSDASAYEIDEVDSKWQQHLKDIHLHLEHSDGDKEETKSPSDVQLLLSPSPSCNDAKSGEGHVVLVEHGSTVLLPQRASRLSYTSQRNTPSYHCSPASSMSSLSYSLGRSLNNPSPKRPEEEGTILTEWSPKVKSMNVSHDVSKEVYPVVNTNVAQLRDGKIQKATSQFEWARKSLRLEDKEPTSKVQHQASPRNLKSSEGSSPSVKQSNIQHVTPKREESTPATKQFSQFEWARRSLNFAQPPDMKTPQTAPPKLRPVFKSSATIPPLQLDTSKLSVPSETSVETSATGKGFKNLLKSWQAVNEKKSMSPPATQTSRVVSTTSKLPRSLRSTSLIKSVPSTENGEYADEEQARIARMVQSFEGNHFQREKSATNVLALGRKFANRYVDSDFYERSLAKCGEPNRALVILENNDTFQIIMGDSRSKGSDKLIQELKIRNVELVYSNHIDMVVDMCECSGSIFSGNDDLISFFLPQMGMACTCGKRPTTTFHNPADPTALENVLRPWQVKFLETFGIFRGDQLVKARRRSAPMLARSLKQWRRKHDMIEFKPSSCALAIDIWAKTAKVYVRSIRKQIDAGQTLLETRRDDIMKELVRFIGDLPVAPKRREDFTLIEIEPESEMEV